MDVNIKQWIDNATYEQLIKRWRHTDVNDAMFQGEIGEYYMQKMKEKKPVFNKRGAHE